MMQRGRLEVNRRTRVLRKWSRQRLVDQADDLVCPPYPSETVRRAMPSKPSNSRRNVESNMRWSPAFDAARHPLDRPLVRAVSGGKSHPLTMEGRCLPRMGLYVAYALGPRDDVRL